MVTIDREYLKIWFSDIEDANDFFEGNSKHLGEFMVNVYREYAELPTSFSCKLVEKYFKTYLKQINFIKQSKIYGKNGGFQKHNNQEVNNDTLLGSVVGMLQPPLEPPLLPKDKSKKIKDKGLNNKEEILPANRRANLFSDCFTTWFKDKFELSYSMKTKDFVGIATIEKYCKENAKGEPIEMFKFILENYDSLAEFYQTNINPSFIASRISEIASMLKKQHTKTQIVKQVENEPVNRKWFPSPSQYYSECISKKQEPFNFWTGNEMTEDEKISEYKIHKVGEYRYA